MANDYTVELSWPEVLHAAFVGVMRHVQNLQDRIKRREGIDPEETWQRHVEGALGEMAAAKLFDLFWSGAVGNRKARDVGGYEIRASARPDGCMIMHKPDDDDAPFILMVGLPPRFRAVGWLYGRECKEQKWWRDPTRKGRWAYFVPQSVLKPMPPPDEREPQ